MSLDIKQPKAGYLQYTYAVTDSTENFCPHIINNGHWHLKLPVYKTVGKDSKNV